MSPARNAQDSRREVFAELARAFAGWREHIEGTKSTEGKRNATRVLASLVRELKTNFSAEDLKTFQLERWAGITGTLRGGTPAETKNQVPIAVRRSLDHVTEYKKPTESDGAR